MIPERKQNDSLPLKPRHEILDLGGDNSRMMGGKRLLGKVAVDSESNKPLISVVTAVRNGRPHIEQTILSILDQSYKNIEYIVIDGGSTDGTLDIIRKYEDHIAYWVSEPDKGIYDAMNKGIAVATGDLIGLLNSDDYYEQGALEHVANAYRLQAGRGNSIVYGDYLILDDELQVKTEFRSDLRFWRGMTICHQAMFVSRDAYRTLSLYDTSLKYSADYAFLVDAIRNHVRFIPTHQFLVTFRNAGATYRHVSASNREAVAVLKKRFGVFSRFVLLFFFFQIIQSTIVTAAKKGLRRTASSDVRRRIKLFYNRILRRTYRKY
jgi:glycosyltransferase involved in cell wall biosynthesis